MILAHIFHSVSESDETETLQSIAEKLYLYELTQWELSGKIPIGYAPVAHLDSARPKW